MIAESIGLYISSDILIFSSPKINFVFNVIKWGLPIFSVSLLVFGVVLNIIGLKSKSR